MKRLYLLLLLAFAFLLPSAVKAQSITVHDFTLVHNHIRNGVKGILMKATFTVNGKRNQNIKAVFAILHPNGNLVTAANLQPMLLSFNLTPQYDSTKWTDYEAFINYDFFPHVAGTMEYNAIFEVLDNTNNVIRKDDGTEFSFVKFTHTRTGNVINVPAMPTVPSTPSVPAQAPICRKCQGVGHYYINGVFYTCTQCGGLGRDWNS
ncbi:MAG: hypothetical protein IJS63_03320 [Bacteroidaceae bacterium]|nr:hypothetical protein [Bacteroidaceae bacterium]